MLEREAQPAVSHACVCGTCARVARFTMATALPIIELGERGRPQLAATFRPSSAGRRLIATLLIL